MIVSSLHLAIIYGTPVLIKVDQLNVICVIPPQLT